MPKGASLRRAFVSTAAVVFILAAIALCAHAEEPEPMTVFFEDFSSHGASSAKQPEEWLNPTWNMPKSSDGKWWIVGTGWYGPNKNPEIARQGLVGNMGIGRRVWAVTTDFRIAPDPVEEAFVLSLKVLGMGYSKGALNVRLVDSEGNGYGCVLAMAGGSAEKNGWKNAITRWEKGKDAVLAAAEGDVARLPVSPEGVVNYVALRLSQGGALTLSVDDKVIVKTIDKSFTEFTELGLSVEYETRFVIDDIKLAAFIDLEEE